MTLPIYRKFGESCKTMHYHVQSMCIVINFRMPDRDSLRLTLCCTDPCKLSVLFLGWMVTRNLNLATNWSAHAQIFTRVYTGKIPQISCNCDIVHCTGHVQWTSILYTLPNFAVHGGRGRGLHVGVNKPLFTPYNLLQQLVCWAFCTLVPLYITKKIYYHRNIIIYWRHTHNNKGLISCSTHSPIT